MFIPVNVFLFGGVTTEWFVDAAIVLVGSQITYIMRFFLRRNINIARNRAWDQTVASRGKGSDFWQPYVEEWENPPQIDIDSQLHKFAKKWLGGWFGMFVIKNGTIHSNAVYHSTCFPPSALLVPFQIYPFVGIAVSSWFRALGTAHILHRRVSDTTIYLSVAK